MTSETDEQFVERIKREWDGDNVPCVEDFDQLIALARRGAEVQWRPIEEAPKDGTRFLAAVDGMVRTVAYGKTSHVPLYGFCVADEGPEDFDICHPTHFMPLPHLPAGETNE